MNRADKDDTEFDRLLTAWLDQAGGFQIGDAAPHLASARRALLESLEPAGPTTDARADARPAVGHQPRRPKARRRLAAGGLGLAAAIVLAIMVVVLRSGAQLSAMDRLAARLREVQSYSYRVHWQTTEVEENGKRSTTWSGDGPIYWQAPGALHEELRIVKRQDDLAAGTHSEEVLEHFLQIFPAGQMGLFVDHPQKAFRRLPFEPTGSVTYPWEPLRMIRENKGEITRELGSKQFGEVLARGYVIQAKREHGSTFTEPVEVWVDSKTDLPLRFEFGKKDANRTAVTEATDFYWNIPLDVKLFEPRPPAGYTDITPPSEQKDLDQITAALRLYAQLSGGKYPRPAKFEAAAIRADMLSLAGLAEADEAQLNADPKFARIEQACSGFKWIEKILRNRYHAGYEGAGVGPQDKGKVLLWWHVFKPDRSQVFYGDLQPELVTDKQWSQLVERGDAPPMP